MNEKQAVWKLGMFTWSQGHRLDACPQAIFKGSPGHHFVPIQMDNMSVTFSSRELCVKSQSVCVRHCMMSADVLENHTSFLFSHKLCSLSRTFVS